MVVDELAESADVPFVFGPRLVRDVFSAHGDVRVAADEVMHVIIRACRPGSDFQQVRRHDLPYHESGHVLDSG